MSKCRLNSPKKARPATDYRRRVIGAQARNLASALRNGGRNNGLRIVPETWIAGSWTPRTHDRHNYGYGYGWFISEAHRLPLYYAWGFGGQMHT